MLDPKEYKKIVRFCQKNGILRFRSGDFEIELKEVKLVSKGAELASTPEQAFPSWDSLTPEQKLLWSATPDINGENNSI